MGHRRGVGDSAINGKTWNEAELDMVVGDYLVMLDKVMTGRAYDPANHQRALRFVTNRSGGAITFLQGEISAILTLIGLPTLKDHPPRWDFGDGLVDSVDRSLTAKPGVLKDLAQPPILLGRAVAPVLAEGGPSRTHHATSARAERLMAKFDPAARDLEARMLARIGVASALIYEQRRLEERGRADLAAQVRLAQPTDGEGCDLISFSRTGGPRRIAVKTTTGGPATPFRLTPAEEALREAQPDAFIVYRLYDVAREARVFRVRAVQPQGQAAPDQAAPDQASPDQASPGQASMSQPSATLPE